MVNETTPTSTTKPRRWPWLVGIVAALGLAGASCSASEPVGADSADQTETVDADVQSVIEPELTTEPEPEEPAGELSPRGNLVKAIGEMAGAISEDATEPWLEFTVDAITVNDECTDEYAEPSENGHFVFVNFTISTASDWPADLEGIPVNFTEIDFSIVGEDSLTESGLDTWAALSCLPDQDMLPLQGFGPGENVVGTVVLDTANPSGTLIFKPWFVDGGGWEWEF